MKILLLSLMLGLFPLEYAMAERPVAVSSKKNNNQQTYTYSPGPKHNQNKDHNSNYRNHYNSRKTLTYDKGQQWYIDLYYRRNGFPSEKSSYHEKKYRHQKNNYYYYRNPGYVYPAYPYPYGYNYSYNRDYYDSRYSEEYRNEQIPLQKPDNDILEQYPADGDHSVDSYKGDDSYGGRYPESNDIQDSSGEFTDNTIYKWTDEKGVEHYTNNKKKVPEEFKYTIIETEAW